MCKKYCGDREFLWRSVGLDNMNQEDAIPKSTKQWPCSNLTCNVAFSMVLGIFDGDHVFCSPKCSEEFEKVRK